MGHKRVASRGSSRSRPACLPRRVHPAVASMPKGRGGGRHGESELGVRYCGGLAPLLCALNIGEQIEYLVSILIPTSVDCEQAARPAAGRWSKLPHLEMESPKMQYSAGNVCMALIGYCLMHIE